MHHNKEYLQAINEMLLDEAKEAAAKKEAEDKKKEDAKKKAEAKKEADAKKAEDKKSEKKTTKKVDSKKTDKINDPHKVQDVPGEANILPKSYSTDAFKTPLKYEKEAEVADTEPKQADVDEIGQAKNLDNPIKQTPRTDKRDTNTDHIPK